MAWLGWSESWLKQLRKLKHFEAVTAGSYQNVFIEEKTGGVDEDRLAQKWRKLVNRKMHPGGKGGLTSVEVEYIEAVLGKDVWDAKHAVEDYIPGAGLHML